MTEPKGAYVVWLDPGVRRALADALHSRSQVGAYQGSRSDAESDAETLALALHDAGYAITPSSVGRKPAKPDSGPSS